MAVKINNSFPFTIWSGLLQNGHREKIGSAIWEFLWCIDKVTKEVRRSENALPVGLVLGGKPIKAEEIAQDLHIHSETVKTNIRRLKKEKYIDYKLAPYGYIIEVSNSKKYRKSEKTLPQQEKTLPQQEKTLPIIYDKAVDIKKTIREEPLNNGSLTVKYPFLKDKSFVETFESYLKTRRTKATTHARELILKDLHNVDKATAIAMLEQSIKNGWIGIFPLKEAKDINTEQRNLKQDSQKNKHVKINPKEQAKVAELIHKTVADMKK